MRVEALEKIIHHDEVENRTLVLEKGDVSTVRDVVGQYFCKHGWAKDVDGQVASGDRKPGVVTLNPEDIKALSS